MGGRYYLQNMTVLKQHNPLLAEEIEKAEEDTGENGPQIEEAASGAPTLIFHNIYVHSKRDPKREAERLVESSGSCAESEAPVLVLGFGLGYCAEALAAKFPEKPIIVVEKHPILLKKALENRELGAFLSRNLLVFVLGGGGEGVTGALSLFESTPGVSSLVIQNRALTGIDEEWYAAVEERIKTWTDRSNVNRATQKRFGKLWVRNLAQNIHSVRDLPGISRLEERLKDTIREKDIPVFLAAAGPTLDKAGPLLGEIHKRCITVAVDTSLRFLVNRGFPPDFVVSVDPQFWNFRHLDRAPAPKTCLIAESAVYPPVLRQSFERIYLCGSFFPLGRFLENQVDPKGELGAGGSVATSAWDFIRILGGREVWIAGLDLSFPGLKTHFHGALFEELTHAESGCFSPVETRNYRFLKSGQPFCAKRQNGGEVLTDKRLSLYAAWFESCFRQFPDIKNYAFSDEGLAIQGIDMAPIEQLMDLPCRRAEIDSILEGAHKTIEEMFHSPESAQFRVESYENARKNLLSGLEEIKKEAENAAKSAGEAAIRNKMGHLDDKEKKKALDSLDNVNKFIENSSVREIAGFLFPETEGWEEEIAAKTRVPLEQHLEFSARFYKALAEAAGHNLLKLKR